MREFPSVIESWSGTDETMESGIAKTLGFDDYVQRVYVRPDGAAVQLYIAYYANQGPGKTLHSPTICIPAGGWETVRTGRAEIQLAGRRAIINEYLIEKDLARRLIFYWYQARGRTVASEYRSKFWMIVDAIARNRNDAALVRASAAVDHGEAEARARAIEFVRAMSPWLAEFIPD